MTSVERIMEYTKLQPEAQLEFETRSNLNGIQENHTSLNVCLHKIIHIALLRA